MLAIHRHPGTPIAAARLVNRLHSYWFRVSSTLWFVPSVMTFGSILLAFLTVWIDRANNVEEAWFFLYTGGAEGAREVLSTTAGSMITVAGIAFSTTMVAFSFASSQLGPRLLGQFMRDRGNQIVLGTFIATFVYCLLVLRTVSTTGDEFVPHIGVTVGLLLALASLGVLIYFIHHAAMALQADYVIAIVAGELDHALDRLYPEGGGEEPGAAAMERFEQAAQALRAEDAAGIVLPVSGYILSLDVEALIDVAADRELLLRVKRRPGDYVHDGRVVAEVWPASAVDEGSLRRIREAFALGRTRTAQQDVGFAINQLVEVAVRALSPGVNDPFTAVTSIDRLTTAILHLMRRPWPSPFRADAHGRLRLIAEGPDFGSLVDAAFHQIRQSGARMPAVMIHLLESLQVLLDEAKSPAHRAALLRHVELVSSSALRETEELADRRDVSDAARR